MKLYTIHYFSITTWETHIGTQTDFQHCYDMVVGTSEEEACGKFIERHPGVSFTVLPETIDIDY